MALYVGGTVLSGGGGSSDFVRIGTFGKDATQNKIICSNVFSSSYDNYLIKLANISSASVSGSVIMSFSAGGTNAAGSCYCANEAMKDGYGWLYNTVAAQNYMNALSATSTFNIGTGGAYPQTSTTLTLNGDIWVDYKNGNANAMGIKGTIVSGVTNFTDRYFKSDIFGYIKNTGTGSFTDMTFSPGDGTFTTDSKIIVYGLKSS